MIDPSIGSHMLSSPHLQSTAPLRSHEDHGRGVRVLSGYTQLKREIVICASKIYRQSAGECEQESLCADFGGVDFCCRSEGWVLEEGAGCVGVGALGIGVVLWFVVSVLDEGRVRSWIRL